MEPPPRPQSPSSLKVQSTKHFTPYLAPHEVEILSAKQRGKLSVAQESKMTQSACAFIEAMGGRIGFPRRTIATAQLLFHRFHLYFPRKDFVHFDVALAAVYASSKIEDTLKKPRDLLAVSYALRFPDLVAKSKSKTGEVDIDHMDQAIVEGDRQRLLAIEKLLIEMISFNFESWPSKPFALVIKFGRIFGASKKLTRFAWRIVGDVYRTTVPLSYPAHVIALSGLYLASLLASLEAWNEPMSSLGEDTAFKVLQLFRTGAPNHPDPMVREWPLRFACRLSTLELIVHTVIDLFIQAAPSLTASTNPSPRTPSSPSPHVSASNPNNPNLISSPNMPPIPYKADDLMRLKIYLRKHEQGPSRRSNCLPENPDSIYGPEDAAVLLKQEGSIRFNFGPVTTPEGYSAVLRPRYNAD